MARILVRLIERYRRWGGGRRLLVDCNFEPSCSHYAAEALRRHGTWRGIQLSLGRLRRCNRRDLVGKIADPVPSAQPH
jgi:hypothetical protein